jgi:small-conductance mechanosensitive channel
MFLVKLLLAILVVIILVVLARWFSKFIERKIKLNSVVDDDDYSKKVGGLVGDIIFYTLALLIVFIGLNIVGIDFSFML